MLIGLTPIELEADRGLVIVVSLLRAVGLFLQPLWIPIVIAFALHGLIAADVRGWLGRRAAR